MGSCRGTIALAVAAAALLLPARGFAGEFGPRYFIERIDIRGNDSTDGAIIRGQLLVEAGETLGADDERVSFSRFRVLALGYFSDVQIHLERGHARGHGVLVVEVVERGTLILNQLFFGTSDAVPSWGGVDVTENNFGGRGVGLGGAFVFAEKGNVPLARPQRAFRLRFADAHLRQSRFSVAATLLYNEASEFFRTSGKSDSESPGDFTALSYRRIGGITGAGVELGPWSRLSLDYRFERVQGDFTEPLLRTLPGGDRAQIDLHLRPGDTNLSTVTATWERDTRSDPVLPVSGSHIALAGEIGHGALGSSYTFYKLSLQYQGWFRLRWGHVISLVGIVGAIAGDAPLFDRYFIGDIDPLVPSRALGLVLSTRPARDFLGDGINRNRYGTLAGRVGIEYLWPIFHGGRYFYGGHIFAGFGGVALTDASDPALTGPGSVRDALPVDVYFDAGLLLDSYIGVFNFSIANFLGRVPF